MLFEIITTLTGLVVFTGSLMGASYCTSKLSLPIHFLYSSLFHGIMALLWVTFIASNFTTYMGVTKEILIISFISGALIKTILNIKDIQLMKEAFNLTKREYKKVYDLIH